MVIWFLVFVETGTAETLERQGSGLIFIQHFGVYFYANQGVVEAEVVCFLPCARKVNGLQKQ